MPNFTRLKDCVVTNKNVIVRVDINVPMKGGKIEDDTRIKAVIPTLRYLAEHKAKVIVISHFGRPEGAQIRNFPHNSAAPNEIIAGDAMSLQPLVERVQQLLGDEIKVSFVDDCVGDKPRAAIASAAYGDVIMLENLRYYKQETKNDQAFAQELASFGNLYVNDAFSCSHRAHASIVGIPAILKGCAGFLLEAELDNLTNLLENAKKPMMAVVGGAKVSTKLDLLNSLVFKAQSLVVGGGMANSFLYAMGKNIGKSLCEKDLKPEVLAVIEKAKQAGCAILLPLDVVVTKKFEENAQCKTVAVDEVADDDIIADIGAASVRSLGEALQKHQTLLWNGPLGAFEIKPFNQGTEGFAHVAASLTKQGKLLSIAGGGDVVSALNSCNLADSFTYISTAGGAFLEWLEGKELPGVAVLLK